MTRRATDLHCHFIPPALLERIDRDGGAHGIRRRDDGTVSFAGRDSTQKIPDGMLDLDERLRWMDREGIETQVLSAWMDFSAYVLPPEAGTWLARCLNELTIEALEGRTDRFRAMAAVPLQAPELAAEELRYALEELGMAAVEIATSLPDDELDAPALEPFWAAAEQLQALVLVHPYASVGAERMTRYLLDNSVSRPAEGTVAAAHLIFGGVLERHPGLTVCLTHGGGFLPYGIGRLDRSFEAKRALAGKNISAPPSSFLRRFYYDTIVHSTEALSFLIERVGHDRVLLGSDYPFPMGDPHPVASVRAAGLSEEAVEAILRANAATLPRVSGR